VHGEEFVVRLPVLKAGEGDSRSVCILAAVGEGRHWWGESSAWGGIWGATDGVESSVWGGEEAARGDMRGHSDASVWTPSL
jgi:hypothetical protein